MKFQILTVVNLTVDKNKLQILKRNNSLDVVLIQPSRPILVDTFDLTKDPSDYVAEAIVEAVVETCSVEISSQDELKKFTDGVYQAIQIFFVKAES